MKIWTDFTGRSLTAIPLYFDDEAVALIPRIAHKVRLSDDVNLAFLNVFELEQLAKKAPELHAILDEQRVIWQGERFKFDLTLDPIVYSIVNVTPDSFYDGAEEHLTLDYLRRRVAEDLRDGADVIELGAKSSRPGYADISPQEEWARLEQVIPALKADFPELVLAVDTDEPFVMERCLAAGVDIINDIDGFDTPEKLEVIQDYQPAVLAMNNGRNGFEHANNVYEELLPFFEGKVSELEKLGLSPEKIAIDAGVGFWNGDSGADSIERIKMTESLSRLGYPLMIAISRKSFLKNVFDMSPDERLFGSLLFEEKMILEGGRILRVHDVKATRRLIDGIKKYVEF